MHSFRHTFCTFAINTGIPISTIQDIVGHSSSAMTAHYAHISIESKAKAVAALPAFSTKTDLPLQGNSFAEQLSGMDLATITSLGAWLDANLSDNQKQQLQMAINKNIT